MSGQQESDELDRLREFVADSERRLEQLRALNADILAGELPDQDQVVSLSVVQDYPEESDDVRGIVKSERLLMIEYGKRLAAFHAACVLNSVANGHTDAKYGAALMSTFLAGPYGLSQDELLLLDSVEVRALFRWIEEHL